MSPDMTWFCNEHVWTHFFLRFSNPFMTLMLMLSGRGGAWCLTRRMRCLCVILSGCFQPPCCHIFSIAIFFIYLMRKTLRSPLDVPRLSTTGRQPLLSNVWETLSMRHTAHTLLCKPTMWRSIGESVYSFMIMMSSHFQAFFPWSQIGFTNNVITLVWGVGPRWNTEREQRRGES